jgi:hypothetical protein
MNDFNRELNQKLGLPDPSRNPADQMGVVGAIYHRLIGPDGKVKQEGFFRNLVTSAGDKHLSEMIAFVAGATTGSVAYATLGVSTNAPLKGATDVASPLAASSEGIYAAYPQQVTSHSGAGEWTLWRFEWGAGESTNGSIGEVGMWSSVDSFVAHALVAPVVNKAAGDTLQIDWGIKFLGA